MNDRYKTISRRRRTLRSLPVDVVLRGLRPTDASLDRVRCLAARPPQLDEIRHCVRTDPALAIATLRHAYRTQRERTKDCTDIDRVVTRLGLIAMNEVLKEIGSLESLDVLSPRASGIARHSARVSMLSSELAKLLNLTDLPRVHMTGLLHDVGKLLTIQSGDCDYESTPSRFDSPDLLNVYERRTLGYDHAKLGWHALSVWGVPEPLPTVVAWHHQGSRAYLVGGEIAELVALTRAADMLERRLASTRDLNELDMWRIERNLACRRLALSPEMLRRQWEHLQEVRDRAAPPEPPPIPRASAV